MLQVPELRRERRLLVGKDSFTPAGEEDFSGRFVFGRERAGKFCAASGASRINCCSRWVNRLSGWPPGSRSDCVRVAVDFSPRSGPSCRRVAERRLTAHPSDFLLNRRSATKPSRLSIRGLKSTATFNASLREARGPLHAIHRKQRGTNYSEPSEWLRQTSPDSESRAGRAPASPRDATGARAHRRPAATSVFWRGRCRVRR